jgi:hypothetical protein
MNNKKRVEKKINGDRETMMGKFLSMLERFGELWK